jgi:hypothetical protein
MELVEAHARYKLSLLTTDALVAQARGWIESGAYFSNALVDIYTQPNPCMADIGPMLETAMQELGVEEGTRIETARKLVSITLNHIASGEADPVEGATLLYYLHIDLQPDLPEEDYVGDSLGLEHVFCWLREVWDCRDGGMILYHTDLPREEAEQKFIQHIVEEAQKLLGARGASTAR